MHSFVQQIYMHQKIHLPRYLYQWDNIAELRPGSQTTYRTRPCKHSLSFVPPTNDADQADAASPPTS